MIRRSVFAAATAWLAVAALAAVPAPAVEAAESRPAVTVYSRGQGFVRETRSLDLRGGRDTLRLTDLPSGLDFSSLRLTPPGGFVTPRKLCSG